MTEQDRVAIVTGASGGIGRAVALRLSADGMPLVLHHSGNRVNAQTLADGINEAGGRAIAIGGDVADETDMIRVFDAAEREYGGVDVVVNTAGIMPLAPIAETSLETFDRVVRTNLRGTFVVDRLAADRVREHGAIINFSSTTTRLSPPRYGAYVASKGGVEALTLVLARELRGRDVTVNTIAPGPVATPLFLDGKSDELIASIAQQNPMGRLGQPVDIAEEVAHIAGPARWINGQVIFVNGGMG